MPVIRIVLLLSVVGGLTLFALSNLSPLLSVVFLGMKTPALPLGTWILGAIAAGAITSFFLQLLSYLQGGSSTRRFEEVREVPPRSRSFSRERPENPAPETQTPYTPPPPQTPPNSTASDWEESSDEDWDFDEDPAPATSNQQDFERDYSRDTPRSDRTSYEVKQEPKTSSKTGSVYSYSYREPTEPGVGKADSVYDANYRLITPPYQKAAEPQEEDDDWGFDDDEEFGDEDDSTTRKR
jgi:uncharacterized integral membrane protein